MIIKKISKTVMIVKKYSSKYVGTGRDWEEMIQNLMKKEEGARGQKCLT